jgi:hypothetical protein
MSDATTRLSGYVDGRVLPYSMGERGGERLVYGEDRVCDVAQHREPRERKKWRGRRGEGGEAQLEPWRARSRGQFSSVVAAQTTAGVASVQAAAVVVAAVVVAAVAAAAAAAASASELWQKKRLRNEAP